jgi:hypothetical protein
MEVPVPTSQYDLTDVGAVKNFFATDGQNYANPETDVIQVIVTAASKYILKRTGRSALNLILPYTEIYDGSGSATLFLRNYPIFSVFSLSFFGASVNAGAYPSSPGYVISQDRTSLALVGGGPTMFRGGSYGSYASRYGQIGAGVFPIGIQNISVNYLAGYTYEPNELATIPGSPYIVTVANAANFVIDLGVRYQTTGAFLTAASVAAPGKYVVNSNTGLYTFDASDTAKKIIIAYGYNGTDSDLKDAATRLVAQNYKRRGTIDEAQKALRDGGTLTYNDWMVEPYVESVIQSYKRQALMVS